MQPVQNLVNGIVREIINPLIAILFTAAVVVFFWGLIQFIRSNDADGKSSGKEHMIWGVVGIFIMLSAYAILKLFTSSFGISLPS